MIPVKPQPEPAEFQEQVRAKGERWLAEHSAGEPYPYWRGWCIQELGRRYKRICAYTCQWVPPGVGFATVDHFLPKSRRRELAYDWSNYRFSCGRVNGRKGQVDGLLDPFLLIEGAFELDLSLMMVRVGETVPEVARGAHQQTIDRLGLNEDDYLEYRTLTYCSYKAGEIRFLGLRRAQPFLAMELCRLGLLHPKDAHHTAAEVRAWLDAEVDTLP